MDDGLMEEIEREVLSWPGVSKATGSGGPGRGGFQVPPFISYRVGRGEIGHVHYDDGVADFTFPRKVHDDLISDGRAKPHGAGFADVVGYHVQSAEDVPGLLGLLRMNYERAKERPERRAAQEKE